MLRANSLIGFGSGAQTAAGFAGGNASYASLKAMCEDMAAASATGGPTAGGTLTINSQSLGSYDYEIRAGETISSFSNATYFTATEDSRSAFVVWTGNLTINAGQTVIPTNRKLFTVLYVNGDLTVNGAISMSARGADHSSATGSNVSATALRIATGTYASVTNPEVPASGGAGAPTNSAGTDTNGSAGSAGSAGGTGGGGAGGQRNNVGGGAGAAGTAFSGGPGGGGGQSGGSAGAAGASDGGPGGAASASFATGGGAGNPGGAGAAGGSAGGTGTGGILIVFVTGTLSGSGTISADGAAGGTGTGPGSGGGGSGGGSVTVMSGTDSGPTPTASGGAAGTGSSGSNGGAGGDGTARKLSITAS